MNFKKVIFGLLLTTILSISLLLHAESNIKVIVSDKEVSFDVPPQIQNGRTLVPLRAIFEALGATVDWNGETGTITGKKDSTIVILNLNSTQAKVNEKNITLDVPAVSVNGRTMVPTRFIAESMGMKVDWDSNSRTVIVKSNNINVENTNNFQKVKVSRVIDGDTIEIEGNKKVRFIGVNTPESTIKTEDYGKEASNYTKSQLEGKEVFLEKDVSETDKYGRLLRYVWLSQPDIINEESIRKNMFNSILCLDGYAEVSTYPPDIKYSEYFSKFTKEAREVNKGLWNINPNGTTKVDSITTTNNNSNIKPNEINAINTQSQLNNRIVYWTPSGKSYHYDRGCKTLTKSKTILEGSLSESGKSDPCNICVK